MNAEVESVLYKEENFLDLLIGNFYDCIRNYIYNFQLYIDALHTNVSNTLDTKIENNKINQLLSFIVNEHENIIKYKGVAFANEVSELLRRKYNSMYEFIKDNDETVSYGLSSLACDFLNNFQDELVQLEIDRYSKKTHEEISNTYNLTDYMESEFSRYKNFNFNDTNEICSKEQTLTLFNSIYMKLSVSMTQLRISCANSTSMYYTILTCRKIISLMMLLYFVLKTIKIK